MARRVRTLARAHATPRSGPIEGRALITLRGQPLHGGDRYACRVFGVVVPSSRRTSTKRVQCRSPSLNASALDANALNLSSSSLLSAAPI